MSKILGFKLSIPEGSKLVSIPMADDLKEYLGLTEENNKNHYTEYLKRYLGGEKVFAKAEELFKAFVVQSIPKKVTESCPRRQNKDAECHCQSYHLTAQMNYFLAGNEFVSIVELNKHLIGDEKAIFKLTEEFFQSFISVEGYLAFDLQRITMHALNAGFDTLSQKFANSDILQNLSSINTAIDTLNSEELKHQMLNPNEELFHIEPQKKFFKDKKKFYKTEVFIQKRKRIKPEPIIVKVSIEDQLRKIGFFELTKVNGKDWQKLINHLDEKTAPYQIAYLDYLGLIDYMYKRQGLSKKVIDRKLSIVLNITERTVKGNRSVLNPNSSEDRNRYTAHTHKDEVEKHYQTLK